MDSRRVGEGCLTNEAPWRIVGKCCKTYVSRRVGEELNPQCVISKAWGRQDSSVGLLHCQRSCMYIFIISKLLWIRRCRNRSWSTICQWPWTSQHDHRPWRNWLGKTYGEDGKRLHPACTIFGGGKLASPVFDLNPTENLWKELKTRIYCYRLRHTNEDDLVEFLLKMLVHSTPRL